MPALLDTIVGMGYAGYAVIAGTPIPLFPSNPNESENQIKSSGAYSSDPSIANGNLPLRNRRSFVATLSTIVTPATVNLIPSLTYNWRTYDLIDTLQEVPIKVILANGEGYSGTGYIDNINLSADPTKLVTLDITHTLWVWKDDYSMDLNPRLQSALLPLSDPYKPYSGWQTSIVTDAVSSRSTITSWELTLNNNWQYRAFLGGYLQPPNPSMVYAGPLEATLNLNILAAKADRPAPVVSTKIHFGTNPSILTINIDRMIRDPGRQPIGHGDPNNPINWSVSYYASRCVPY